MSLNRVVITGAGAVSPYGIGVPIFLQKIVEGRSAVKNMREEWVKDIADLMCYVGAPLSQVLDEKAIPRKFRKTMGRTSILAFFAVREALQAAAIEDTLLHSSRLGISYGSSTGSAISTELFFVEQMRTKSARSLPSGIFFQVMSHTNAANIAQAFNIKGRVLSTNSACSSAAQALGSAYEFIKHGYQDIMICGGSDELHVTTNASFDMVQAASYKYNDQPEKTPRPFDKNRDGTVCAEGASCLILESETSALNRRAKIYGEIIGYATNSSGVHMAHADVDSIAICMQEALSSANCQPSQIDYVNAHATGTIIGDVSEAKAIEKIFGPQTVPVSSLKGHFGHTLGASGVLELIAVLEMMEKQIIVPTLNLDEVDADCSGLLHIRKLQKAKLDVVIKNSFAFGGINTVLVVKRYER